MSSFLLEITEGEKPKPSSNGLAKYGTKGKFTSLCCKYLNVTPEYNSFTFHACFLLNNSVCSVKVIKYIWQGTAQSHYLRCIHSWPSFVCGTTQCIRMAKY
jgi:hypothetical protein